MRDTQLRPAQLRRVKSALMAAVREIEEERSISAESVVRGGLPQRGDLNFQVDRPDRGRVRHLSKLRRRLLHAAGEIR